MGRRRYVTRAGAGQKYYYAGGTNYQTRYMRAHGRNITYRSFYWQYQMYVNAIALSLMNGEKGRGEGLSATSSVFVLNEVALM